MGTKGAIYFVTFRTADSLPRATIEQWIRDRDAWQNSVGTNAAGFADDQLRRMPPKTRADYQRLFTERFDCFLDECHGACVLRDPANSVVVAQSLQHFDGVRYNLGDFVVMPNHVHLLVQMIGDAKLAAQCKSWKRFTAAAINERLGQRGHFWQDESFDHLVRSEEELDHLRHYIANNPTKAHLRPGEFNYFRDSSLP